MPKIVKFDIDSFSAELQKISNGHLYARWTAINPDNLVVYSKKPEANPIDGVYFEHFPTKDTTPAEVWRTYKIYDRGFRAGRADGIEEFRSAAAKLFGFIPQKVED